MFRTVDGRNPANHLECINFVNKGINYQLVSRIAEPSTVSLMTSDVPLFDLRSMDLHEAQDCFWYFHEEFIPIGSMGRTVYLPTNLP